MFLTALASQNELGNHVSMVLVVGKLGVKEWV